MYLCHRVVPRTRLNEITQEMYLLGFSLYRVGLMPVCEDTECTMPNTLWGSLMVNMYWNSVQDTTMIYKGWDEKKNKGFPIGLK